MKENVRVHACSTSAVKQLPSVSCKAQFDCERLPHESALGAACEWCRRVDLISDSDVESMRLSARFLRDNVGFEDKAIELYDLLAKSFRSASIQLPVC